MLPLVSWVQAEDASHSPGVKGEIVVVWPPFSDVLVFLPVRLFPPIHTDV